ERSRRDVVVVDDLRLRAGLEEAGHGAAGGELVEQPGRPVTTGEGPVVLHLADGPDGGLHEQAGLDAGLDERPPDLAGVAADGVPRPVGGDELVDGHGHRPAPETSSSMAVTRVFLVRSRAKSPRRAWPAAIRRSRAAGSFRMRWTAAATSTGPLLGKRSPPRSSVSDTAAAAKP